MYTCDDSLSLHTLLLSLTSVFPFLAAQPLFFTYLELLLLLSVVRIPIHSCTWFAINCSPLAASPAPRHPTNQVTYLHRRHQQHQPSRLIQSSPTLFVYFININQFHRRRSCAIGCRINLSLILFSLSLFAPLFHLLQLCCFYSF
jgi:hypothetical protein